MANTKITKIDVKIAEPKVQQITAQSNPAIWAILQPPKETEKQEFISQWPAALRKQIE